MSKFRTHLKTTGQTLGSFAKRIGVSPSYMSEIAGFKKEPSLRTAHDISVATGGVISVIHWLDPSNDKTSEDGSKDAKASNQG